MFDSSPIRSTNCAVMGISALDAVDRSSPARGCHWSGRC